MKIANIAGFEIHKVLTVLASREERWDVLLIGSFFLQVQDKTIIYFVVVVVNLTSTIIKIRWENEIFDGSVLVQNYYTKGVITS